MKKQVVRHCGWIAILCIGCAMLNGCNTVEGVGKDIKATGQAIERAGDTDD